MQDIITFVIRYDFTSVSSPSSIDHHIFDNIDLEGLGLELPKSIAGDQAVKRWCAEVNLDPRLVELGHLVPFTLEFLTK